MSRVKGHALRAEGAAHDENGIRLPSTGWGKRNPAGRAVCECGQMSPVLPSTLQRVYWHQDHKALEASTMRKKGLA